MLDLLALLGAGLIAIAGAFFVGRRGGKLDEREKQERERYDDHIKRMDAGRDAVRDGRDADPDSSLRRNDGAWD